MKNTSCFIFILGIIFVGVISISAMERQRLGALSEQMDMAQTREAELRHRRERLAQFQREVDRAWEQADRAWEQLERERNQRENAAEGAAFQ